MRTFGLQPIRGEGSLRRVLLLDIVQLNSLILELFCLECVIGGQSYNEPMNMFLVEYPNNLDQVVYHLGHRVPVLCHRSL